MDTLLTADT
jgi:hypothetical protein